MHEAIQSPMTPPSPAPQRRQLEPQVNPLDTYRVPSTQAGLEQDASPEQGLAMRLLRRRVQNPLERRRLI